MQTGKNNLNTRLKIIGMLCVVLTFCLLFCAQTFPKNEKNENTNPQIQPYSDEDTQFDRKYCVFPDTNEYVYIGGRPIGISVSAPGLIVTGETGIKTQTGEEFPTRGIGVQKGDILISANGEYVNSVFQFKKITQSAVALKLVFLRDGKKFDAEIRPVVDKISGEKKVGLLLKEDIGGVGTLTFVTQQGKFAALGHCIADTDTGLCAELDRGHIYNTEIDDVIKGEKGAAGGLVADVNRLSTPIGNICCNTNLGLYGNYTQTPVGDLYRIAAKGEAKIGKAQLLTTIEGSQPKFYDIDIVKVISQSEAGEKGMVISVRDSELLQKTGGIVQGMSGSPIVQNGILIGAVTHVFIQDPTRGYAIHSRFMYEYAQNAKTGNLYEYFDSSLVA